MPTLDQTYVTQFRGFLGWNGFTNGQGNTIPPIAVELYINNLALPIRKPKITEHASVSQIDPISGMQIGNAALFYGSPDVLQMELSGWIITLQDTSRNWLIHDANGSSISSTFGNIPYSEVINAFLSGRVNVTAGGAPQRKDPDYYISPQGYKYLSPLLANYVPTFGVGAKKQFFQMTLYLES